MRGARHPRATPRHALANQVTTSARDQDGDSRRIVIGRACTFDMMSNDRVERPATTAACRMQSQPTTCWQPGCGPRCSTVRSNALLDACDSLKRRCSPPRRPKNVASPVRVPANPPRGQPLAVESADGADSPAGGKYSATKAPHRASRKRLAICAKDYELQCSEDDPPQTCRGAAVRRDNQERLPQIRDFAGSGEDDLAGRHPGCLRRQCGLAFSCGSNDRVERPHTLPLRA